MFPFKRRKHRNKNQRTPTWVIFLVLAFLGYTMITNNSKKNIPVTPVDRENGAVQPSETATEQPSLGSVIDPKKLVDIDAFKGKFAPQSVMKLQVQNNSEGDGGFSVCGQKATIIYSSFTEEKKEIEKDKHLTFQIGVNEAMPALELGVIGMKKNATRTIFSPGNMAYGAEKFARNDVPALANINFEVKMLDLSPELPDPGAYRILGDGRGAIEGYICGSQVKLHLSLWDVEGKKLYNSKDNNGAPIVFTIGKSEVFLGLEQGVLDMSAGMRRNLIVPPSFQKTLQGNAPTTDFPLPKNQTVLVDVESVP